MQFQVSQCNFKLLLSRLRKTLEGKELTYFSYLVLSFVVRLLSCSSATPLPSWEYAQCFPHFYNTLYSYLCSEFIVTHLVPSSCGHIALLELSLLKAEPAQLWFVLPFNHSSVVRFPVFIEAVALQPTTRGDR